VVVGREEGETINDLAISIPVRRSSPPFCGSSVSCSKDEMVGA